MFYSHEILQRRGGKFGVIWLAATHLSQLSRRDIASVDVEKICNDVLDYILVRIQPSSSGKRPRFSLYLSAQLMFGIVKVFERQHEFLLADLRSFTVHFGEMSLLARSIDLHTGISKLDQITLPDPTERLAQDVASFLEFDIRGDSVDLQFFESSHLEPDLEMWKVQFPAISTSSKKKRKSPEKIKEQEHHTTDNNTITMIEQLAEMPAADAYQVPGTVDLPDLGAADLELLNNSTLALNNSNLVDLNQPVDSPNKRRRPNEDASEKETRSERSTKARRTLETDSEHQRNESKAKASRGKFASEQQEKGHKKEREGLLSLFEEPKANGSNALEQGVEEQVEQTIEDKVPETPSRDQSTASAFVSLHLSPVGPSPRAATKRKKTLIMDKEIMISRSEIRENFENNSTSYQRGEVLNELFKITERSESSSVLLQEPTRKAFKRNSTIRKFWKKHARTETYTPREKELRRPYHLEFTVPGYSWQNDTRDESIEQERVGTPLDRSRQLSTGDISLTDRSQRRASSSGTGEPEGTAGLSTSLLNTTDVMPSIQEEIPVPEAILEQEQEPQVDVGQAEQAEVQDQQLPLEEAIPQDVLVPPAVEPEVPADLVNDVPPEEQAVLEEAQPTSNKQDKTDDVARSHRLVLPESRRFRFSDLIYPHYKRLDVARAFHSLLELCARRQVRVRQKESFGDIDIIRAH